MFFIGLDLGKRRDYTAIVIVERIEHRRAFMPTAFERLVVRYVERMPLGLPYPRIVQRVKIIVQCLALQGNCKLVVDATGVGAPVVDMLKAAQLGCHITEVVITGSGKVSGTSVPKDDLMSQMLLLFEQKQLTIGKLKEGARLVRELSSIRSTMRAEGANEHDDLVIALALACWQAKSWRTIGERNTPRLF